MLRNTLLAATMAVASITAAADDSDAKTMQGSWTALKAELAGKPMPPAFLKSIALKLDGGKYEVNVGGKLDRGTYTLDQTTNPKSMTLRGTEGPNEGKTFLCIYKIDADTLEVCYDLSGTKTPTAFSTAGSDLYLATYARKKD
jgi:uncharacterized protein (TIGR03067 family)